MSNSPIGIASSLSDMLPEAAGDLYSIPWYDVDTQGNIVPATEMSGRRISIHRRSTTAHDMIPLHTHIFYEYIYCRQVPDMEYLVGAHRYRIRSGDIIFIPPGTPHRPMIPENCTDSFVRDELWIGTEMADMFGKRLPSDFLSGRRSPNLFRVDAHWQAEVDALFQKGTEENEKRPFRWDNAIEGYAWLLLVIMSRALLDERTQLLAQESPNLFDSILAYLEANLSRKITLEETASHFYISKSTVNRIFQKQMGTSFYRCLTQRRMLAAQHLITEGLSLEEVSVQVGFSDYATFYRAFKQEFGISPRQFRKMQNLRESAEPLDALALLPK